MRLLIFLFLLLLRPVANSQEDWFFPLGGSGQDTFAVGYTTPCEGAMYEYTIDINNYNVPDSFAIYSNNWDLLLEVPFIPCNTTFLYTYNDCRDGFVSINDNGIYNGVKPTDFGIGYPGFKGAARISITVPSSYIWIEYIGNPLTAGTKSDMYVAPVKVFPVTTYVDTILYQCQYPPMDVLGTCSDTIYNVDYRHLYIPDTIYVCEDSTLNLPSIEGEHEWFLDDFPIVSGMQMDSSDILSLVYYHEECNDTIKVPLKVLDLETVDTILYIHYHEPLTKYNVIEIHGDYFIKVINGPCEYLIPITVIRLNHREVYIPNAFSPNGDGVNDIWGIYDRGYIKEIKDLKIFNRWGSLVHSGNNWDGGNNPEGVYVYILIIKNAFDEIEIYKGDITLTK